MTGGELLKPEVYDAKPQMVENFKNIKPEIELSGKELNDAVSEEFSKAAKEADGQLTNPKEYLDANGVKYREGDNLLPNTEFEVNGYRYKTDDKARVVSAEGRLQVKNHEGRNVLDPRSAVDKGDMRKTDDRGHLIADRFNGSGGIENLVPMDSELNQHGDYNKLENTLADAVKDGAKVDFKVEPIYKSDSTRPSEFKVSYSINGDKEVAVFKNESEAKS